MNKDRVIKFKTKRNSHEINSEIQSNVIINCSQLDTMCNQKSHSKLEIEAFSALEGDVRNKNKTHTSQIH